MDTQERECPGAWIDKIHGRRYGSFEQFARHPLDALAFGAGQYCAQRPKRPAVAIFRPHFLEPAPIITHEVSETLFLRIEGVPQECQVAVSMFLNVRQRGLG